MLVQRLLLFKISYLDGRRCVCALDARGPGRGVNNLTAIDLRHADGKLLPHAVTTPYDDYRSITKQPCLPAGGILPLPSLRLATGGFGKPLD